MPQIDPVGESRGGQPFPPPTELFPPPSAVQQLVSDPVSKAVHSDERVAARLHSLLDALPAAVVLLDGQGRVQELNPAARQLLAEGLEGLLWRDLIARFFAPAPLPGGELQLRSGRIVTLSTCPLGREPGQILLLHDVTDERRLRQHLEHQRRLADMGRMAASLAHQIRTPLASALLYISQLNAIGGGEVQQRCTQRALQSLRGLERLISDMLLYARGDAGECSPVDAAQLLQQALEPLRSRLSEQGIELAYQPGEGGLSLQVNPTLVVSALQNLITNAVQAMPAGGLLGLSIERQAGRCGFSVRDSGPGIPLEWQGQLFEPFVSHREGGSGLGLAVVRAVARVMGGEVDCDSTPGQGSRFTLWLPLVEAAQQSKPCGGEQ